MSHQRGNQLPDIEVLGEWDHGVLDPLFLDQEATDANNLSYQDFKRMVLKVENKIEGAVRNTCHEVEHVVEEMIQSGGEVQPFDDELLAGVDVGVALIATEEK